MINAVLRLRRDNDYNYEKIKNSFVPARGEVCLVDTAKYGLRAVVGDGISTFAELEYTDVITQGYFFEGSFYAESSHETVLSCYESKLYFDITTKSFYYFFENEFVSVDKKVIHANEENPGILKLYSTIGQNTDGTMTQKAITDELNEKFELALNIDEELLIFGNDLN